MLALLPFVARGLAFNLAILLLLCAPRIVVGEPTSARPMGSGTSRLLNTI
jgi:hypothetical protein